MDRRELTEAYWQDAIYDPRGTLLSGIEQRQITEGDPREPLKHKAYQGHERRRLPSAPRRVQVPGAAAGAERCGAELCDAELGAFLQLAYGVQRHDLHPGAWPYHRTVPSSRCFFPTELYVVGADGVSYYDPMHHELVLLRAGDFRPHLSGSVRADLSGASAVVVLTSLFWKSAFRYRDYAYRLCTAEAGIVAGAVLLAASAIGREATVHFQFESEPIHRVLGIAPPEEDAMLVLPLYTRRQPGRGPERHGPLPLPEAKRKIEPPPALRSSYVQPSAYDGEGLGRLSQMSEASRATSEDAVWPTLEAAVSLSVPPRAERDVPAAADEIDDLAALLRQRDSGPSLMDFAEASAPLAVVWRIAREVTRPYGNDLVSAATPWAAGAPLATCHLAVRAVDGLASGFYRVRPDGAALTVTEEGSVSSGVHEIATGASGPWAGSTVHFARAPLVVYLSLPRRAGTACFGPRSFRILNQLGGIAAQRVCIAAAASGLSARVHNGYSARLAEQRLALPEGDIVLFQIALGMGVRDASLSFPIVF